MQEYFCGKTHDQTGRPEGTYVKGSFNPDTQVALLDRIRVEQELRGQGLGSALLEVFVIAARKNGMKRITGTLEPEEGKEQELRSFYERHGFSVKTVRIRHALGGESEFETLEYDLSEAGYDGTS